VAAAVVNALKGGGSRTRPRGCSRGLLEYIPFPDALRGKYQCYTQADLAAVRDAGCDHQFAGRRHGCGEIHAVELIH
jgi:ADP-L-glycero-D-manno-heptose 6-epimerase